MMLGLGLALGFVLDERWWWWWWWWFVFVSRGGGSWGVRAETNVAEPEDGTDHFREGDEGLMRRRRASSSSDGWVPPLPTPTFASEEETTTTDGDNDDDDDDRRTRTSICVRHNSSLPPPPWRWLRGVCVRGEGGGSAITAHPLLSNNGYQLCTGMSRPNNCSGTTS